MGVVPFRARGTVKTIVGLDGRILRAGTMIESLGYARDVLGKTFMDLTHPDDRGISEAVYRWLLEGHTRLILSKRYVSRDRRVVPVTIRTEVVHDTRGRPRYLRAWNAATGEAWGPSSKGPRLGDASDVRVVREGFVAEPVDGDGAGRSRQRARRVGRLVLPPELL